MEKDYLFSLIIPYYNAEKTIRRLLDSISRNSLYEFDLNKLEIIAVDDASTDNSINIVKEYTDLNINIINNVKNNHYMGSVRQAGLEAATGEWVLFADADDMIGDNALKWFEDYIKEYNPDSYVATIFANVHFEDNDLKVDSVVNKNRWLHGKIFNRKFLKDNNINFEHGLKVLEDVNFNAKILCALETSCWLDNKYDMFYSDFISYYYISEENSITRKDYKNELYTMHYIEDYAYANLVPYIEHIQKTNGDTNLGLYYLLGLLFDLYFLFQQNIFLYGTVNPKGIAVMGNVKEDVYTLFNFTNEEFFEWVSINSELFCQARTNSVTSINQPFIETQTFADFWDQF